MVLPLFGQLFTENRVGLHILRLCFYMLPASLFAFPSGTRGLYALSPQLALCSAPQHY